MQELLQLSFMDKLIQVVPQTSTIFCGVPVVLVVLVIEVVVTLYEVSHHFIWSFEE